MNEIKYHLMFGREDFEREAVLEIRRIIKAGLFKKDNPIELKQGLILELNESLSRIYKLDKLKIEFIDNYFSVGAYSHFSRKIILNKPSLVTFLHEFCHYLKISRGELNNEDIARGWSISLYFQATPVLCKSAIERGLIIHQKSVDDTPREPIKEETCQGCGYPVLSCMCSRDIGER